MATSPERYVAIITVEGTGIEEWYIFDDPVSEEEVKQIWLDDVRDNRSIGERLAKKFADKVEVEKLWETDSAQQEEQTNELDEPIPLGDGEDEEETSTSKD